MRWTDSIEKGFRTLLPTPFTIAIILSIIAFLLAFLFGNGTGENQILDIAKSWEKGLWNSSLLVFAVQMMLMLVLGHVLALSPLFDRIIQASLSFCDTTSRAAFTVTLLSILVGLFNWGLGLIFGAIFARKVAENALKKGLHINYPLIGAAAYSTMAVWHGGLSGSSTTKVAEAGHLTELMAGAPPEIMAHLPDRISFSETVFSGMNITVSMALLLIIPSALYLLGKRLQPTSISLPVQIEVNEPKRLIGAEKIDHSRWVSKFIGGSILLLVIYKMTFGNEGSFLDYFNPNNINLALLGLGIALHKNFKGFLDAIDEAIPGVSGILIQFPLYFGIMGIMQSNGLVEWMSAFFVEISNANTYPLFTFLSAGIVNIFVPSGGGQWAVQGPIIVQAAHELNIPLSKCIMAMAYGDELTNMLQPFWALPLLGITGLKAKEILPYTLFVFFICSIIFISALILF